MLTTLSELAQALVDAHDGGPLVTAVPDALVPAHDEAVFALQDEIIARLGPVAGWKIAVGTGPAPMCAPLPANRYFADGATIDGTRHRHVLAEVEVALTLGADLGASASAADAEAAIASLHPALEFIGSPFPDRKAQPRNLLNGDLQSNGAVVVGPAAALSPDALATLGAELWLDGAMAHSVTAGAAWDDTIAALAYLARHAAARNLPLRKGQVIITGARALGPLAKTTLVEGRLAGGSTVSARLV